MGGATAPAVRALAFAEPEPGGAWGAVWLPAGASPIGVLGSGDQMTAEPLELEGSEATEAWRLTGTPGTDLALEGLGQPAWRDAETPGDGFQQLCRVTGTVHASRGGGRLECLGWRSVGEPPIEPAVNSVRLVAGWFDEQDGFGLMAGRSPKFKGQDEDLVIAVVFEPAGPQIVAEPRLSTTYTESGRPTRAGVELWIEAEADPEHLYPRRAVGQAVASAARWSVADASVEAHAFQWFTGGREGSGVYLLVHW